MARGGLKNPVMKYSRARIKYAPMTFSLTDQHLHAIQAGGGEGDEALTLTLPMNANIRDNKYSKYVHLLRMIKSGEWETTFHHHFQRIERDQREQGEEEKKVAGGRGKE